MQKTRAVRLFVLSLILIMMTATTVFANGNNTGDGGGTDGGTGGAVSGYKALTNHPGGIRLSIYWAPSLEAFEKGINVKQLGDTVDIVNSANPLPNGYAGTSSKTSVYHYRTRMYQAYENNADTSIVYWTGVPRSLPSDKEAIARWLTGAGYNAEPQEQTWAIIPALTQKMNAGITAEQFKQGFFPERQQYGQYKVFYEPLIPTQIGGVGRLITLRDAIRLERYPSFNLLSYMPAAVTSLANATGLEKDEKVLNMVARPQNWELPVGSYSRLRSVREVDRNYLKDEDWVRYAGVGVFTPKNDTLQEQLVKTYVKVVGMDGGEVRYETVDTKVDPVEYNPDGTVKIHDIDVTDEGVGYLNDIVVSYEDITQLGEMHWEASVLPKVMVDGEGERGIGGNNVLGYSLARRHSLTYEGMRDSMETIVNMNAYWKAHDLYEKAMAEGTVTLEQETEMVKLYYELIESAPTLSEPLDSELAAGKLVTFKELKKAAVGIETMILDTIASNAEYIWSVNGVYNREDLLGLDLAHAKGEVFVPGKQSASTGETAVKENRTALGGELRISEKKAGGKRPAMVYVRYIFSPESREVIFVDMYKDGKYVTTQTLSPRKPTKRVVDEGGIKVEKVFLSDIRGEDPDFADAKFVEYSKKNGKLEDKVPGPSYDVFPDTGISSYLSDDNFYARWRVDLDTPTPAERIIKVEEWRLSRFVDTLGYNSQANMMLNLLSSRGCVPASLTPSGPYSYDTVNPNGLVTQMGFNPANLRYTDYLHSKALTKGSYSVTLGKPFANVDVTGNINAIKSTLMTELRAAKWVTDAGTQGGLNLYDIVSENKGVKYLGNAVLDKKEVLRYGIRNQSAYTHNRGVYHHYTTIDGDTICGCYTTPYQPGVTYLTADYSVRLNYERYKPENTDWRMYDSAKDGQAKVNNGNGELAVSLQSDSVLSVYPEVPMLFANDAGAERVLFATGDLARKVRPVNYHTMEYDIFIEPTVVGTSVATAMQAKVKANALGLSGKHVIHKGSGANVAYKISKDKGSAERGELIVKTYALDIADETLKTEWGNGGYSPKAEHEKFLSKWGMKGETTSKLEVKGANGNAIVYTGPAKVNNVEFKEIRKEAEKTYTLIVRGGVVTHVNGMTMEEVKNSSPVFYEAMQGMRLAGGKESTVLSTFEHQVGKPLEEQQFADLAKDVRNGVDNLAVGKGWYSEDSTVLKVTEHTTVYGLPRGVMFADKVPMSIRSLETPVNKNMFYSQMGVGHTAMSFRTSSADLGDGVGELKSATWMSSKTASEYNDMTRDYGVPNVSITDTLGLY